MCYNNNKSFFPYEQAIRLSRDGKSENFQLVEVIFMLVSANEMLTKAKARTLRSRTVQYQQPGVAKAVLLRPQKSENPRSSWVYPKAQEST